MSIALKAQKFVLILIISISMIITSMEAVFAMVFVTNIFVIMPKYKTLTFIIDNTILLFEHVLFIHYLI